ncbi:reverse transcriptase domain-containing protein [Nephila pilipes]|uniref:Reverse transcriptase domain-containing protein n=1 Tax=Nephila pilipes TaxID=299642 RepID=A0A8X6U4K4_NEPPI|nr:reverse transcriptase domain-containing protein [Nephila pilipes]
MPHSAVVKSDKDTTKVTVYTVHRQNKTDSKSRKILRLSRVSFGISLSSFILAATNKYHIKKSCQELLETARMFNYALYVDDLFYGADTVEKASELSQRAAEILMESSISLRKFETNSKEFRNLWFERDIAKEKMTKELPLKILGIIWNSKDNTFKLDV